MIICTFAGHREVCEMGLYVRIKEAIRDVLTNDTDFIFYTGGMGKFNELCASAVRVLKREYVDKNIKLILVLPYMIKSLNSNKEYYKKCFDDIIIPEELADCHYKSAITKRNRWMIDNSEYVISYIERNYGGAYTTVKYAVKNDKIIISLANTIN